MMAHVMAEIAALRRAIAGLTRRLDPDEKADVGNADTRSSTMKSNIRHMDVT